MQSESDGDYKFILNYQDHLTKFIVLRPLKTKTADEVSDVLLDIFCLLGAPYILHSDNGREFCNQVKVILYYCLDKTIIRTQNKGNKIQKVSSYNYVGIGLTKTINP